MIKQHSIRKPSVPRDGSETPAHGKASGDASEDKHKRSKSKTKVPRTVRYDLENALVGLCDVWFEDIKPYLLRNNVKMHIHDSDEAAAGGDRGLPPAAPACSHLDPASSAPYCELCRLLFNAANSIESAVSQAASAAPTLASPPGLASPPAGPTHSGKETYVPRPSQIFREFLEPKSRRRRRDRRASHSQPLPPPPPVLRLCRTYSVLPDLPLGNCARNKRAQPKKSDKKRVSEKVCVRPNVRMQAPEMKNKMVQTEKWLPGRYAPAPKVKPQDKCFGRRQATTSIVVNNKETLNETKQPKIPPLFQNDLIDIIAKNNDKRLEILYESPGKNVECVSTLNLVITPKARRSASLQKKPWK